MDTWQPVAVAAAVTGAAVGALYGVRRWLAADRAPMRAPAFSGGLPASEHALSRFHVRWYPVAMVFLAFDMEMLFMYPWVRVVGEVGAAAVVEMFVFLGVLTAAVVYAYREGAFRWA